jgi:hypothetical protein
MAFSAAHSKFYRGLFSQLYPLIQRWGGIEDESANYFATLANVAGRISLIQEHPKELGVLQLFQDLPQQMIRIQLSGLEAVMQTLWKA